MDPPWSQGEHRGPGAGALDLAGMSNKNRIGCVLFRPTNLLKVIHIPTVSTSDGIELFYRDEGEGSTIVLVPGWGCTTRYFDRQIEDLSSRFRVVTYDPRGHGKSEKTRRGQRMGRVAHDVHDLLIALGLRDVTLLGWSLGASVVLYYVDLFGADRVSRIACVAGGPLLINRSGWTNGFLDLNQGDSWRTGLEDDFDTTASNMVTQFFYNAPERELLDLLTAETLKTSPADGAAAMTWDCINQNMVDLLPHIAQPTLVALGKHDSIVPAANSEVFASIPHVQIEIFKNSGHAPFIEETNRFNEVLARFVNDADVNFEMHGARRDHHSETLFRNPGEWM